MAEVHLICNGEYVSLSDDETIAQTWRFTDIQKFETTGAYTKQFRIPYEPNQTIFGPLFDVNAAPDTNYFFEKLPAELRVSTLPVSVGYVRVIRVIKRLDVISDLEIVFYAETPDLFKALGTLKLADIDALDDLDHTVNYDAVLNTVQPYRYILCDRGYKFSEQGEAGTRPIYNADIPIYAAEMTPVLQLAWIFDKIITEAGFTYDADDLYTLMEAYWMPWINQKFIQYAQPVESYFFRVGYTATETGVSQGLVTGLSEQFDNNGDFAADVYTAPHSGWYTFRLYMTVTPQTGTPPYVQLRLVNPSTGFVYDGAPFHNASIGTTSNFVDDVQIQLHVGDEVQLSFITTFDTVDLEGSADYLDNAGTGWALIGFDGVLYGQDISMSLNAPDMLQSEFIKDMISMHNLAVIPDRLIAGKIKFIPMAEYLGFGNSLDWTQKLDVSKDIVIQSTVDMQKKKLKFTYKEGGDVWSKLYKDAGRVYGEYLVDGYTVSDNEDASVFATGDSTVQLVTQSTPCNAINGTSVVVPKFVNQQGEFVLPGPRILYIAGTAEVMLFDDDEGVLEASMTAVNLGNNFSSVLAEVDDFDLNFWTEKWTPPPHNILASPYSNLFNLYWRPYLNEIYSEQARIMEAYFDLSLSDVMQFGFDDKIWIKNAYWRILEISDYKIGVNESTKVTLIKIIDPVPDCELTPIGVLSSGIVVFEDGAGDEQPATRACCERYGYTFGLNDDCYAFGARDFRQAIGVNQGTNGLGISSGETSRARFMIALASNLNWSADNILSYVAGRGITADSGNPMSIAVGDTLKLEGSQRGSAMFGKNVYTNLPGHHLGGGWTLDDRETSEGAQQSGTVMFSVWGDLTNDTTELELLIEGIAAKRINLPDGTGLACVITLNMAKIVGGVIAQNCVSQHSVYLYKAGTAGSGTLVDIFKQTTFVSPVLTIDTATDTDEHRIILTSSGAGYPHNNVYVVATLQYTQVRPDYPYIS